MYVRGMFIQMLTDLKTVSKSFNISIGDVLELPPFEFNIIKLMIESDIQKENEAIKG